MLSIVRVTVSQFIIDGIDHSSIFLDVTMISYVDGVPESIAINNTRVRGSGSQAASIITSSSLSSLPPGQRHDVNYGGYFILLVGTTFHLRPCSVLYHTTKTNDRRHPALPRFW